MSEHEHQEEVVTLEVPSGYREDGRVDKYIARFIENASRTKVQRGIDQGRVRVNGEVVDKASHSVKAGDVIECRMPRPKPIELVPEPMDLDVIYEDEALLVVDKPADLVVHPAYGHRTGTLVHGLLHHVGGGSMSAEELDEDELDDEEVGLSTINARPNRSDSPVIRPGLVHRLDKDTTGLMVVAKQDHVHAELARQFAERTIERRYRALVWGVPDPPEGRIEGAIGRDPRDRKRMAVVAKQRGKHAVTHYRVIEALAHAALVQFRLETGRTHQIRVHARHIGHPVLGDPQYGGTSIHAGTQSRSRRAFFENLFGVMPRQALHAHTLGFTHPISGEQMHFEAPLPHDMQYVLDRLREVEPA